MKSTRRYGVSTRETGLTTSSLLSVDPTRSHSHNDTLTLLFYTPSVLELLNRSFTFPLPGTRDPTSSLLPLPHILPYYLSKKKFSFVDILRSVVLSVVGMVVPLPSVLTISVNFYYYPRYFFDLSDSTIHCPPGLNLFTSPSRRDSPV